MTRRGDWLAFDSSGDRSVIGLDAADGRTFARETDAGRKHGRDLIPTIRDLLGEAGVPPRSLAGVGVGLGPGSYTGLRIGLTAARMLAYAAGTRLVGFESLEAIARSAPGEAGSVRVIADAQRGDVYAADFRREAPDGPLVRVVSSRILRLADWLATLQDDDLVVGPALAGERVRASLPSTVRAAADVRIVGARLVELARETAEGEPDLGLNALEPLYLRRSAAEDQWEARKPAG